VGTQDLHLLLRTLSASGDWTVFESLLTGEGWITQLFYRPTGAFMYVRAEPAKERVWSLFPE
jgi:hypothetical protein